MEGIVADGGVTPQVGGKRKREEGVGARVLRKVGDEAVDLFVQGLGEREVKELDAQPKKKKTADDWYEEAVDHLSSRWPNRGFFILQELVRDGHEQAEIRSASCYFTGNGVACNRERAVGIWKKYAAKGDALSQRNLSVARRHGMGVGKAEAKAKKET